jgi:hypothetical protein
MSQPFPTVHQAESLDGVDDQPVATLEGDQPFRTVTSP